MIIPTPPPGYTPSFEEVRANYVLNRVTFQPTFAPSPADEFYRWLNQNNAEVEAGVMRRFADFIQQPEHPGLDSYTLGQVAMEARSFSATHPNNQMVVNHASID